MNLIIIDGDYFINRAFYTTKPYLGSNGKNISCLFSFQRIIENLFQRYPSELKLITFDSKGGSKHRNELFPDYKGNRPEKTEDMRYQQELLKKITPLLGYPTIQMEGIEADDIIGTIAKKAAKNNIYTTIASRDKDLMQLLDNNITQLNPKDHIYMNEEYLMDKLGIRPDQMIDLLSLVGDTADNIPGVFGCGEKTAAKLLTEFDNLDNIYSNIESVKPKKIKESLIENKDNAYLSKQLATIITDIEIDFNFEDFTMNHWKPDRISELETELELELLKYYQ